MLLLLPIAVGTQTDHSPPQTGMAVWACMAIKSPYAVWPARLDPYAPILPVWARPIPIVLPGHGWPCLRTVPSTSGALKWMINAYGTILKLTAAFDALYHLVLRVKLDRVLLQLACFALP
jgi:hypothetical protein